MKQRRSDTYFNEHIWKESVQMAEKASIDVTFVTRRTRIPSRLRNDYVLECTGGRDQGTESTCEAYKVIYYQVMDKILVELHHRFGEQRPLLHSIAALSPKSPLFLNSQVILPLAEAYKLEQDILQNQLRVLLSGKANTAEEALEVLGKSCEAFPEAIKLYKIALTIPVASASSERSFSALKRVKTYLRSTIGEQRLNDLSVLAIERDLSKSLDYELVVDNFMLQNPRRITLK